MKWYQSGHSSGCFLSRKVFLSLAGHCNGKKTLVANNRKECTNSSRALLTTSQESADCIVELPIEGHDGLTRRPQEYSTYTRSRCLV